LVIGDRFDRFDRFGWQACAGRFRRRRCVAVRAASMRWTNLSSAFVALGFVALREDETLLDLIAARALQCMVLVAGHHHVGVRDHLHQNHLCAAAETTHDPCFLARSFGSSSFVSAVLSSGSANDAENMWLHGNAPAVSSTTNRFDKAATDRVIRSPEVVGTSSRPSIPAFAAPQAALARPG
jgi:hypothetical protein